MNDLGSTFSSQALQASNERRQQGMALFDIALCMSVFLALLLNAAVGPLSPLIVLGFIPAFVIIQRWRLPRVLAASWVLLLLPLFAIASYVWSQAPSQTLRYGTIYLITVMVGVMIGSGIRPQHFLKAIFLSLLLYGAYSIVDFRTVAFGADGSRVFIGLQASKNQAGDIAALTILSSTAMLAFAVHNRHRWTMLLACAGFVIGAITLVASRSTGALIATAVAWSCLCMWLVSRRLPLNARMAIFITAVVVIVSLLATVDYWLPPLFDFVLEASGKDRGLTGRHMIWDTADNLIERNPYVGIGYNAFWLDGNLEANRLLRAMGINDPRGFNFHNTYREITVHLGFVGFALFLVVFVASAAILLLRTMIEARITLIFASSLLVYFSMKFPLESFGFKGMSLSGMLLFTVLAMGYSSLIWRNRKADTSFA